MLTHINIINKWVSSFLDFRGYKKRKRKVERLLHHDIKSFLQ